MKRILQMTSFLLIGMLIVSACTEEQTGESLKKITDKIDIDLEEDQQDEIINDTIPSDTVVEELILPVTPPPAPPKPIPPSTWPPEPIPEPIPGPWPIDPPLPEPVPVTNPIVDFPDVEPKFVGGDEELMKFIVNQIQYPEIDREVGNQGRVFVEFVVEKDGSITNVKVLRGVSATIDREAKRIVRLMPNWEPGVSGGKIVRCIMRLPIAFRLD